MYLFYLIWNQRELLFKYAWIIELLWYNYIMDNVGYIYFIFLKQVFHFFIQRWFKILE